jgi:hypothetical protein
MKFLFDVDGLITEAPKFFSAITGALKGAGHTVIVITDFDEHYRDYREKELKNMGIVYDELVITPHKGKYFAEHQADFALDDDQEYYQSLHCLPLFLFGNKN